MDGKIVFCQDGFFRGKTRKMRFLPTFGTMKWIHQSSSYLHYDFFIIQAPLPLWNSFTNRTSTYTVTFASWTLCQWTTVHELFVGEPDVMNHVSWNFACHRMNFRCSVANSRLKGHKGSSNVEYIYKWSYWCVCPGRNKHLSLQNQNQMKLKS